LKGSDRTIRQRLARIQRQELTNECGFESHHPLANVAKWIGTCVENRRNNAQLV